MNRKRWAVLGSCLAFLLIYLSFKQTGMVVTWLAPGADCITEKADWIFGKYSSGKIVHARECVQFASGWDALSAIWPLSLALVIVSLTIGATGGYILRQNDNVEEHKRELYELERKYIHQYHAPVNNSIQSEAVMAFARARIKEAEDREADVKRREKAVAEKEQNIEKAVEEKVQPIRKQLQRLQEDHKNRGYKMEGLEKDKVELKRRNLSLEKENLTFQEKILELTKEIKALKSEK